MSDTIRVGLIGAGQIATHHMTRYKDMPQVKMVAVADLFPEKVKAAQDRFGIPNGYADFKEMLNRDDLDAVDVCVHNNKHAPLTIAALEAGKHVYCEKPMAGTYRDAENMYKAGRLAEAAMLKAHATRNETFIFANWMPSHMAMMQTATAAILPARTCCWSLSVSLHTLVIRSWTIAPAAAMIRPLTVPRTVVKAIALMIANGNWPKVFAISGVAVFVSVRSRAPLVIAPRPRNKVRT